MILKVLKQVGTSSKNSVRKIFKTNIYTENSKIYIELTGSGFLYNMVRIIVGTLLKIGNGKLEPEDIPQIIEEKNRKRAGMCVPPNGLVLEKVFY